MGASHPDMALLQSVPGVGWVLGYTIASEIGDIARFRSPKALVGYTGLCPFVRQSGKGDHRGPLTKQGPKYLRWALIEATSHAARHPRYASPTSARASETGTPAGLCRGPRRTGAESGGGHLAHAHQTRTLRAGRPRQLSGRLTTRI